MTIRSLLLPTCVFLFTIASPAHAQEQSQIRAWQPTFSTRQDELVLVEENIRAISVSKAIDQADERALKMSEGYLRYLNAYSNGLLQVSYIYLGMFNPKDVEFVRQHLNFSCENLRKTIDSTRSAINELLPLTSNPAVRAEIMKARDLIGSQKLGLFC